MVLGGASVLAACGGESGTDAGTDSGGGTDTGGGTDAGGTDAGGTDAGGTVEDTGVPEVDAGGGGSCESTNVTIGSNHPAAHALVVSAADVAAATDRTYDIMGASAHTHSVTITAAQFAMLASGASIMVTSTSGAAHTHTVTVVCA